MLVFFRLHLITRIIIDAYVMIILYYYNILYVFIYVKKL